jgi:YVTN family beta-propeller protein
LPGGSNAESYSSAYQTVTIPGEVASATLSFWEYPQTDEPRVLSLSANVNPLTMPEAYDTQYALVLDENGEWLRTLLWQASDRRLWAQHQFDLSDYAGQTIRLHFGTYNDGVDGLTAMFVDDVSLEICPEPPPTSTPTPTPELDRFLYLPLVIKGQQPPTATATPTPTPTATPGTICEEMVTNGDFELDAAWSMPITPMQAGYSSAFARSGQRSMRTGMPESAGNVHSYSSAYQTITLPPGPGTATLIFWYYPVRGEAAATAAGHPAEGGFSILDSRFPGFQLPDGQQRAPGSTQAADRQYAFLRDEYGVWHLLLWTLSDARTWLSYEADLSAYMGQTVRLHFETYNDGVGGSTAMYLDDASIQVCTPGAPTATPTPTPTPPQDALIIEGQWVRSVVGHQSSGTLYAYTDLDLFRSDDAGDNWGRAGDSVGEFLMSPADPDVLYLGPGYPCQVGGPNVPMYKSTDGGASWFELPAGLNLKVLAAHLTDPDTVYAAGCDGPYLSTDGGDSWTYQPSPYWGTLEVRHIAPVEPTWQTVYAAGVSEGGGGAILESTDSGATWQQVTPLTPNPEIWWITDLLVDPANPLVLRFAEPHTPWWSRDGGATWSWSWTGLQDVVYISGGPPDQTYGLYDLELDIADHEQVYLGTIRGLYISNDGGATWYKAENGFSWQNAPLGKLLLLEDAPNTLYLVRHEEQGVHVCHLPALPPIPTPTPTATPTPVLPYVLSTIALPADSHPHGVALDTTGNRVFVAHHGPSHNGHALSVIDGGNLAVSTTVDLGGLAQGPNGLAYHEASDRVYVANRNSDNVSVVDPTSGTVISHLAVGTMPNGVAVVDDLVYVANFGDGTATVIDAATQTVSHTIPLVGNEPSHMAVEEPQGLAYLSLHGDGSVGTLRDGDIWKSLPGVPEAYGIAFDVTSRLLYVGNRGSNHSVTVADMGADPNNVIGVFGIGAEPFMLGVNHNTGHLFVATGDTLQVRRTADMALLAVLPLPVGAEEGLAVDSVRNRVYVTSRDSDALTVVQDM